MKKMLEFKKNMRPIFLKFKNEYLGRSFATLCGAIIVILTFAIIFFLTTKGLNTFIKHGYSIFHFVFSGDWNPMVETLYLHNLEL